MADHSVKILKSLQQTPLAVDVILLQEELTIQDLLEIGPGSILHFQQSVKTPAYLSVNGKKFATGTVVQMGENYGLKIGEIYD